MDKNTNAIPIPLLDLMSKLNFLGMLERGKKINWNNLSFSDSGSFSDSIYRYVYGESRKGLIYHIYQIIDQAIKAIDEYNKTEFCSIIVNGLANSKNGIQNLKTTYQKDPCIVAQLEACISNINIQLEKNKVLLNGHSIHSGLESYNDP